MQEIKPRKALINIGIQAEDTLAWNWSEAEQLLSFSITRDGEKVGPGFVDMLTYYERTKKPKILSKVRYKRARDVTVSPIEAIQNYDHVWAIDTNRNEGFGVTFHVAALCAIDPGGSGDVQRIGGTLFGKTAGNPERFGW